MAKKIPSNFYQEVNIRKLDKVFSNKGDLPTPSVSDEGKVIKVNNEGKYALLPDGGAQTMTVAITYDETTEEYSADKTHAEIVAALQAGVIVKATYSDQTFVYAGTNKPSAFDGVYFTYIQADSEDQLLCKCFEIDVDDRIVYSSHNISEELPTVTSEDENTLLQVDSNGNWNKGAKLSTKSDFITMPAFMPNGENISILPVIEFNIPTKVTIDSNGYYESDFRILGFKAESGSSSAVWMEPSMFDDIHIDICSSLLVDMLLNNGTNDIQLYGTTHWINNRPTSSSYVNRLRGVFMLGVYKNILGNGNDLYSPYDITITHTSNTEYGWHIKFKLSKITTT